MAPRSRFDKTAELDGEAYHLVLLCQNQKGYENLIYLVSQGFLQGFYNKPRVDWDLLKEYHEGLICLSACLAGQVPRLLDQDNYEGALELATQYRDLFGPENYFIEVQDHGIPEQKKVNEACAAWPKSWAWDWWPPTTPTISSGRMPPARMCSFASRREKRWMSPIGCALRGKNST